MSMDFNTMMEQVQQQIGMTTEQNLVQLRNGLMRALQEITEPNQNGKPAPVNLNNRAAW